jgi:hypothetical protein
MQLRKSSAEVLGGGGADKFSPTINQTSVSLPKMRGSLKPCKKLKATPSPPPPRCGFALQMKTTALLNFLFILILKNIVRF